MFHKWRISVAQGGHNSSHCLLQVMDSTSSAINHVQRKELLLLKHVDELGRAGEQFSVPNPHFNPRVKSMNFVMSSLENV
ncbi:hypothetical protein CEXT_801281 [Caerostris extrusa]|uniref:Uncharacterized protein n=1 Tax=Caerostris extrusa TaxID=172846 RepID=A0AAV4Q0C0_CAEEX|nr:hypothetical protein CEXT_801281 [Caerostris extrusa]